ncbi:hypothetical protein Pst134EA_031733 [Puccinia striiformis f. sp. tritici]|uniref:uncharacterized protein n=1 Tax=Puccinia striiformis f. sp. tritici TaxID=168172 RepID=UPI0020079D53|nr:uncharacterized protein Pst134EA_031733 [Puccinia striiformis f. sp. tritici]KAH9442618.1 hypothetical protein Pst134EA_031733 [Puccinia striiformis f. sp. tritici]
MGVPLLPIWLLLTSILGPIGESTCLTTYKDTFELARVNTEFLISQRKEAKEISGGPCTVSEMEYAHKVTWKHPGTSDSKGKASVGTGADHAAQILQQLKKTVFSRFYNPMNPKFDDGFIKGTEEKYLQQLDSPFILDLGNLHSGMEETTKDTHALDALRQKDPSSTAGSKNNFFKIFKDFHDIHTVLKIRNETWPKRCVFLTYEFKKRIRLNGFTEEIHGLLDILNEENWRKVENLYLVMRIELQPLGKMLPNANIRPDPRDIGKWEKIKICFSLQQTLYPKLQGIDKSFKLLHDVLQVGEYKLAELIKLLNYESSLNSPKVKDVPTTLYLTGMHKIRAKSKLPSSVDSQINEAKGRQIIGLLESPTGSSSLKADNSEALIERNQEMKRISEFWDPQSKTSWMESLKISL